MESPVTQPKSPLTSSEVEAILKTAREPATSVRSDVVSDEPLGPGDVQYLRNTPLPDLLEEIEGSTAARNFPVGSARSAKKQNTASPSNNVPDLTNAPSISGGEREPRRFELEDLTESSPACTTNDSTSVHVTEATSTTAHSLPKTKQTSSGGISIETINDIDVDVTLELGRAEVTIDELLQLRDGSVVPLDKRANEPIDILANGRLIARGEVIVVNDRIGVRICEIIGGI